MSQTIYAVFTEGWDYYSQPVLKQLFYEKSDADSYAEELRNEEMDFGDGKKSKVYFSVTVDETEVQ